MLFEAKCRGEKLVSAFLLIVLLATLTGCASELKNDDEGKSSHEIGLPLREASLEGTQSYRVPDQYDIRPVWENEQIDSSGQWRYLLSGNDAAITGYIGKPENDEIMIPSKVDGYVVSSIVEHAFSFSLL